MSLPIFHTDNKDFQLMQTGWAQQLNPVIELPFNKGILLQNISLLTGSNTVNHKLGRKLQGWVITRIRSNASVYDTQDLNQTPQLTLSLVASGNVTVDLLVF